MSLFSEATQVTSTPSRCTTLTSWPVQPIRPFGSGTWQPASVFSSTKDILRGFKSEFICLGWHNMTIIKNYVYVINVNIINDKSLLLRLIHWRNPYKLVFEQFQNNVTSEDLYQLTTNRSGSLYQLYIKEWTSPLNAKALHSV